MATLTNDDYKDYVREIQRYLRDIAYHDNRIPFVAIDGIYDEKTAEAVSEFQRINGLQVTGEVDKTTFDSLRFEYERVTAISSEALRIKGFTDEKKVLDEGDSGYAVYLLQIMLKALSERYDNIYSIEINGKYDSATAEAVNAVKRASNIDTDGTDKRTWDAVTRLYNSL